MRCFVRPSSRRPWLLQAIGALACLVGLFATFVLALLVGVVVHLNLPGARRAVTHATNVVLAHVLAGRVTIERLEHLGLDGLRGVDASVSDPDGVAVLHLRGLRVDVDGIGAARSALGGGPIVIDVAGVVIDDVHVNLDGDPRAGGLRLANAFATRSPSEPEPARPKGRGVTVDGVVDLRHAWIHGTPPGAIPLDAELEDLRLRARLDPNELRATLERLRFVTRGLPRHVDPHGDLTATLAMSLDAPGPPDASVTFDGAIGAMPTKAEAKMFGGAIDARVHTQDPTGENASALAPEIQLREAISLHAEAHGPLSKIDAAVAIALGRATIDAKAIVGVVDGTHVDGELHVRHLDAHAIVLAAPTTDLGLDAKGKIALRGPSIDGELALDTLAGTVDGEALPPIAIRAKHENGAGEARVTVDEPGAKTVATVILAPHADGREGQRIAADVHATIPDLRRVARIARVSAMAGVTGSVAIDARAAILLPERSLDARATVAVRGLAKGAQRIASADVFAAARGTVERPIVDAELRARDLSAGDLAAATVDASAKIAIEGSAVTVSDARVELVREDVTVGAEAQRVRIDGGALSVEAAAVTGLGEPILADVVKSASVIRAKVRAPRIDLKTVAIVAGEHDLVSSGEAVLDVDATLDGARAKGTARVALLDVAALGASHVNATLDGSIDGRDVTLDARARVADAADLALRSHGVRLGGPALAPASWAHASGELSAYGVADLGEIAALLPKGTLPLEELGGDLELAGRVGRVGGASPPSVRLHLGTRGLVVGGASTTKSGDVETVTTWRTPDVDVALDLQNDAASGQTTAALRASDPRGVIAALDVKTILPFEEIFAAPALVKARALEAPLSAKLVVPPRRLAELPAVLGLHGVHGGASVVADLSGTAYDPRVRLVANARGLRGLGVPRSLAPDVDVVLDYDGETANLTTELRARGRPIADLTANVAVRARDVIDGAPDLPWKAGAKVRLSSLPLEAFPTLADRRIRGSLSGQVTLDGLHEDARLHGRIDLDGLTVGPAVYERATITLDAERGSFDARARLDQAASAGFFEAKASAGIMWGAALVPTVDTSRPAEATLAAKAFRALVAEPFVHDVLPTLDGLVDADASAKVLGGGPPTLQGKIVFRDGTVLPAALGTELRGVRATATLSPDGTIAISDVSAKSVEGEILADAELKLSKWRLARATANVRIGETKPFALALGGAPLGGVVGRAKIEVFDTGERLDVSVDVPTLSLELPKSIKAGVQSLDTKENVKVGVFRASADAGAPELVPLAFAKPEEAPTPDAEPTKAIEVAVHLGKLTIDRPNSAGLVLSGRPRLLLDDGLHMSGQIQLDSGWANLQGKRFKIEGGTVTFTEESPPNPVVVATAKWEAPNGANVYADFVGPVKTGKVTLRSEPPMSKNDILALLLFGSVDGANASRPQSQSQSQQAATGLGGDIVAEGLTQALDDLAGIKANARIDTSRSNNPRPEVEFQLSPKVSVAFSHVIGTPPITEPDKNLASVGWRVYRNWSLETTVGDRGRALFDAIWQRRY